MNNKDELLNSLIGSLGTLTRIEENIHNFISTLDEVQDKLLDVEHYIEDNKENITATGAKNLVNLLADLRRERRQIKQMWEIWNTYGKEREKIKQKDYREFLINDLKKTDAQLNTRYNYRYINEEMFEALNKETKRRPGRPKKVVMAYNNIEEESSNEKEEN